MGNRRFIHEEYDEKGKLCHKQWFLRVDATGIVMQFCVTFLKDFKECRFADGVDAEGLYYTATDIGYHSPKPVHEGEKPMEGPCQWMGDKLCYYDGTSLGASDFAKAHGIDDDEAIFRMLMNRHSGFAKKMLARIVPSG